MKVAQFKENILYSRLRHKDKEAFIKAYDIYAENIYRFIYFKVGNKEEAEDLTSNVFLKTWDYIQNNQITDHRTLRALLYKVARNAVIDHYRKKNKEQDDVPIERGEDRIDPVDHNQDLHRLTAVAVDYSLIEKKLFELKDEYREVIILRYVNELSVSEIAEALDKTKGNVRVLVFRALKALRELVNTND